MDWKDLLSDILSKRDARAGASAPRGSRPEVERFLDDVALPALQDLRRELEQHGRRVKLDRDTGYLALTVQDPQGREEFFYGIRIRTTRPATFVFPEFDPRDGERTVSRAEVMLRSGPASYDLCGLSREQVIRHFLHEYRKWIGWRKSGGPPQT